MANLVFKFSWDHRPFPYNSAQGKRQFMLPFASGIPNLTPDYTQVRGLGTAAPLNTGRGLNNIPLVTDSLFAAEGRMVDEYRAQGTPLYPTLEAIPVGQRVLYFSPLVPDSPNLASAILCHVKTTTLFQETLGKLQNLHTYSTTPRHFFRAATTGAIGGWIEYRTTANTTVDANGFLKSASPVVKLFKDHIELNSDAEKQLIDFEKVDVGNYLL
ncbi:phage tail protein, partial [Acinetobacter baumannii]